MLQKSVKVLTNVSPVIFKKENAAPLSFALLLSLANIGLNVVSPYILSDAFSRLASNQDHKILGIKLTPVELAGLFGVTWGLSRMASKFRKIIINRIASRGVKVLLSKFTRHLMDLSLEYHSTTPPTNFFEIENKCFQSFPDFSSEVLVNIIPTTVEIILAAVILSAYYGADIGLSLLGVLTIYTLFNIFTANSITKAQNECLQAGFKTHAAFDSLVKNYETIHCFNTKERELGLMDGKYEEFEAAIIKKLETPDKIALGQLLITGIGLTFLLVLMGSKVSKGNFEINDFAIICYYLLLFSSPLANFGEAINKTRVSMLDLETVFDFFEIPREVEDRFPHQLLNIAQHNSEIEFKNVSFSYPGSLPILNSASFKVSAGRKTAIVGMSGVGKTTISKLLYRFYEPISGKIEINNQDISGVSLTSLREAISIVPQKPVVFNDTIYTNIEYGALAKHSPVRPPREKIIAAAKAASMDRWITTLPQQLMTKIGENGKKISGGQLQRLAIARAIIKDPFIFILDEATSSLDSKTENDIQRNFDQVAKGRTTLVITHRLNTIVNADKIIYLHEGKVAEEGTHDELLAKNGFYAKAWKEQADVFIGKNNQSEEEGDNNSTLQTSLLLREDDNSKSELELDIKDENLKSKETKGKIRDKSQTMFFAKQEASDSDPSKRLIADEEVGLYGTVQAEVSRSDEKRRHCVLF